MKIALIALLTLAFSLANAESWKAGDIRTLTVGVPRDTPERGAEDVVQNCLGDPLYTVKMVTFEGIKNLRFDPLENGQTYSSAECIYKVMNDLELNGTY